MTKSLQYLILCCLLLVTVATISCSRTGYPRTNRGFKSQGLSTARGFGKRDPGLIEGRGGLYAESLRPQQQLNMESLLSKNNEGKGNYPYSWLVEELQSNPEFARLIVERLIDENGDGEITQEEMMRRPNF